LATKYPESFDAAVPEELIYSGQVLDGCCWKFNWCWTISIIAN
jgi:hypothetical protein